MRDAFGHHASRIPPRYVLFLNLMEPFTVERESCRPPLPMVPCRCRGPNLPVTRRGKSVTRSPFTVEARTSVERSEGRSSVMPPFTVVNSTPSLQLARPSEATIEPFTVVASAYPVVDTCTLPFTV